MKRISLALAVAVMASCTSVNVPEGTAMFDFFTYEGRDSALSSISLPTDDSAYNPLIQGYYPDPSICSDGKGNYYIVTSTGSYYPGIPVFHSTDLLNWKQLGYVLDRPSQFTRLDRQRISEGIYAPDIKYNPADQTFYMVTTDIQNGIFYVKAEDPAADWSDPVYISDITGADPSFFFDEDGTAYLLFSGSAPDNSPEYQGHRTVRAVKYDLQSDKLAGDIQILVNKGADPGSEPYWVQGPRMYKEGDKYILICSENAIINTHASVAFSSDAPMGPFTAFAQNPILTQRDLPADRALPYHNVGHADLVKAVDGQWWAVFTGSRPNDKGYDIIGRETYMLPVSWSQDGCPVILPQGEAVPATVRHEGAVRESLLTAPASSFTDDFDEPALDSRWMTLRSDASGLYSLKKKSGYLSLQFSEIAATKLRTPSLVCTRILQPEFEVVTRVYSLSSSPSEKAGILLFKDERHQYFLGASGQSVDLFKVETVLQMVEGQSPAYMEDATTLAHRMLQSPKYVDLKVVSDGKKFSFWYAPKGKDWTKLIDDIDARFLSFANAGGFTAPTVGLYAVKD